MFSHAFHSARSSESCCLQKRRRFAVTIGHLALLSVTALGNFACSHAGTMTSDGGYLTVITPSPVTRSIEMNRVRGDELARVDGSSLEDALRQIRPELLRANSVVDHGSVVSTTPSVYLNGRHVGSVEILRVMPIAGVTEVQYLRPFAARAKFGTDCPCAGGAIAVATGTSRE